jgi:hypothetical protein
MNKRLKEMIQKQLLLDIIRVIGVVLLLFSIIHVQEIVFYFVDLFNIFILNQ